MSKIEIINEIETPKWVKKLQYPMIVAFAIYGIINWESIISSTIPSQELFILVLIQLCLIRFFTLNHEYSHCYSARLLGYKAKVHLKEKLCIVYGDIKPIHFLLIVMAPAVIQSVIIVSLLSYHANGLIFIIALAVLYMASVTSDVYLAIKSIRYLLNESVYFTYIGDTNRTAYFAICKKKTIGKRLYDQ